MPAGDSKVKGASLKKSQKEKGKTLAPANKSVQPEPKKEDEYDDDDDPAYVPANYPDRLLGSFTLVMEYTGSLSNYFRSENQTIQHDQSMPIVKVS